MSHKFINRITRNNNKIEKYTLSLIQISLFFKFYEYNIRFNKIIYIKKKSSKTNNNQIFESIVTMIF